MKSLFCFFFLFFFLIAKAQKTEVGQICPDPFLPHVINYKSGGVRLSAFRPKLVILDFWNTHCLACISAFPHLDSLQQKFRDQVEIILVNSESREATLEFFARRKKIVMPRLTMITGDTQLIKIFSREGYPYSVWIDGKGVVRYITAGYNTTEAHIRSLLKGEAAELSRASKTQYVSLLTDEAWRKETVFFSALSLRRNHQEVGNSIHPDQDGQSLHLSITAPALDLFKAAFAEGNPRVYDWRGSVELSVKDSATFRRPQDVNLWNEWDADNWYNYELVIPAARRNELYTIMQEELCRYFSKSARWEKRKIMGIALVRIPPLCKGQDSTQTGIGLLRTQGGKPSGKLTPYYGEVPDEASIRVLVNQPFSQLSETLRTNVERMARLPFIDETAYIGNIDISLPWKTVEDFDLDAWRRALRKYGLDLLEKPLDVNVLVIQDRHEK